MLSFSYACHLARIVASQYELSLMSETNDNEKEAYAENLAKVNEVCHVLAASDICNAQGQILAKKGTRIDTTMVERITRFKLLKPLEDTIMIENELTAQSLAECFEVYLTSDPSTRFFYERYAEPKVMLKLCESVCQHPIVRQKLTAISLIMPEVFEQAMFCAWFGCLLAIKTEGKLVNPLELFLAGMCHDLGMIHISPSILNKADELEPHEWRQIHVHPVIAYNILKETPGISKAVARAVLEHHENLDGTGYPRSKPGAQLSHEGQLLNLLDMVNAIYNKRCKDHDRPLSDIIPIIQISRHSRFGPLSKKLIVLLREMPHHARSELPEEHLDKIVATVKSHGQYINRCIDIAKVLIKDIDFRHDDESVACIQNAIIHISMSVVQSGVINEAYMRWLDQVAIEKLEHAYKEMEDAFLMMQEIIYQINRLRTLLALYLDKHQNAKGAEALSEKALQLSVQTQPAIAPQFENLWLFSA